ncbi:MAG: ArsR/SmtB family transcription factor [Spirochaetota bacterium]
MKPAQHIQIHENLAVELVFAAAHAASRLEPSLAMPAPKVAENHQEWLSQLEEGLSPFEKADLTVVFSTVSAGLFLFYQIVDNNITDPEDLPQHIASLSPEAFLAAFKQLLRIEEQTQAWISPEVIQSALESDRADVFTNLDQEASILSHLLSSPIDFQQRTVAVLTWFCKRFVLPYRDRIEAAYQSFRELFEQSIEAQPEQAIDELTGGNYETVSAYGNTYHFYPGLFIADGLSILMPGDIHLIFGIKYAAERLNKEIGEYTDELLKALGDPKRLNILRQLRKRPQFSKELADQLHLSAATVSYHMDILFRAELIKIERPEGRRFYYALNPKGIEKLMAALRSEFLNDQESLPH